MITYAYIPGYQRYRAVSDGTIESLGKGTQKIIWKKRKLDYSPSTGYQIIKLCKNGIKTTFSVHFLICTAFHGPKPDGMEVCHNDGNCLNNNACNLRWDIHRNNMIDMIIHGTSMAGTKHHSAKLNDDSVRQIRKLHQEGKLALWEIGIMFNVTECAIGNIVRLESWKHVS